MRIIFLIIPLLLFVLACNTEKKEISGLVDDGAIGKITVDKTKWRVKEGLDYPFKGQMLNNIVYNDTV